MSNAMLWVFAALFGIIDLILFVFLASWVAIEWGVL
jgi:hypothetical protein